MQISGLREYVERRGWKLDEEYIDEGSGSRERRPALDRLTADARRRAFDAVVVFRFDRFARSVSHLARALDEFRALGIEFVSLHEAIDTSTPMGQGDVSHRGSLRRARARDHPRTCQGWARKREETRQEGR
jgi:DNA invertase Pin-like site-specific DNA recombinase